MNVCGWTGEQGFYWAVFGETDSPWKRIEYCTVLEEGGLYDTAIALRNASFNITESNFILKLRSFVTVKQNYFLELH